MAHSITTDCIGCGACARICPSRAVSGEAKGCHWIDPRRCIDCGACGLVCPAGAVKDVNGDAVEQLPRNQWAMPVIDAKSCKSCGLCLTSCPVTALGWILPFPGKHPKASLERPESCLVCGFCRAICPVGAIALLPPGPLEAPVKEDSPLSGR
ncbi:MAG: 4Fe-4S binding protein [bacterium]